MSPNTCYLIHAMKARKQESTKSRNQENKIARQQENKTASRDGILRERREHARGRNLADCGRICGSPRKSFGSIEEMWKKYSK